MHPTTTQTLERSSKNSRDGEETRTIRIPIVGDAKSEARESFYVNLAKREERGDLAQPARIEIVLVDDD